MQRVREELLPAELPPHFCFQTPGLFWSSDLKLLEAVSAVLRILFLERWGGG